MKYEEGTYCSWCGDIVRGWREGGTSRMHWEWRWDTTGTKLGTHQGWEGYARDGKDMPVMETGTYMRDGGDSPTDPLCLPSAPSSLSPALRMRTVAQRSFVEGLPVVGVPHCASPVADVASAACVMPCAALAPPAATVRSSRAQDEMALGVWVRIPLVADSCLALSCRALHTSGASSWWW